MPALVYPSGWRSRYRSPSRSRSQARAAAFQRLLESAQVQIAELPAADRPTAAFCANDLIALGLLQEMTRRQIRVPDDLAIVGYDDIEFAAAAAVPLSSVRQPRQQLGRTAAQLLLEEALGADGHQHRQVIFQPELVVRQSSTVAAGAKRRAVRPARSRPEAVGSKGR